MKYVLVFSLALVVVELLTVLLFFTKHKLNNTPEIHAATWGQCYKTFLVRNLRKLECLSLASLSFVGEARRALRNFPVRNNPERNIPESHKNPKHVHKSRKPVKAR